MAPRGRPQRLTVEQLLDEAIALVDEAGLAGLTMTSLAKRLGVGTMTLYGYVESREELMDLAAARLTAQAPATPSLAPGDDWVETIVALMLEARAWHRGSRAFLELRRARPVLIDAISLHVADELAALVALGFTPQTAAELRQVLNTYLLGQLQLESWHDDPAFRAVEAQDDERARRGDLPASVAAARLHLAALTPEQLYERAVRAILTSYADELVPS